MDVHWDQGGPKTTQSPRNIHVKVFRESFECLVRILVCPQGFDLMQVRHILTALASSTRQILLIALTTHEVALAYVHIFVDVRATWFGWQQEVNQVFDKMPQ